MPYQILYTRRVTGDPMMKLRKDIKDNKKMMLCV